MGISLLAFSLVRKVGLSHRRQGRGRPDSFGFKRLSPGFGMIIGLLTAGCLPQSGEQECADMEVSHSATVLFRQGAGPIPYRWS